MKKLNWVNNIAKKDLKNIYDNFSNSLNVKAYPCTKGKYQIPISLEPFLIKEDVYKDLQQKITIFLGAVKKVVNEYYVNQTLQKIISIDTKELNLIKSSSVQDLVGVIRLDMFYGDKPKIIEINSDFPDGFFMHDITYHEINNLIQKYTKTVLPQKHSTLFANLLLEQGISKDQSVFIAYEQNRQFIDEFILSQNSIKLNGWKNTFAGLFADIKHINNNFYYKDTIIKVIRRGAELSKVRDIDSFISLFQGSVQPNVQLINNFKMRLFGHKTILAILCQEQFQYLFTPQEQLIIKELLPETLDLNQKNINIALKYKNKWVLKPADLTEGEQIIFGNSKNNSEWASFIKNTVNKDTKKWILQEKIAIPSVVFNLYDKDHGIISQSKKYDFCPHIVLTKNNTHFGNILVRFSSQDILNVFQGGGITYAYID